MITKAELTLDEVWEQINQQLSRANKDKKHPFRLTVIGTVGEDAANLRTVVLRKFNRSPFSLVCFTDIRSQKIQELQKHPKLTWLFWHPKQQIQIKAIGTVSIEHQTENTRQYWNTMHIGAKVAYLTRSAPSEPQEQPTNGLPSNVTEINPTELEDVNFAIIHCEIDTIEYLRLNGMEHRRAKFEKEKEAWKGTWLVP